MNLLDIYDEITIGARNIDQFSAQLNELKDKVQKALEDIYKDQDMFRESVKMHNTVGDEVVLSSVFLQGSYGTNTAIKRKKKNADADMGIIFNNKVNRSSLVSELSKKFPEYEVKLKKPCITINKDEEYSVDIAIYYKKGNRLLHQNAINDYMIESESLANPHLLLSDSKACVLEDNNPNHRKIIRLSKYFIKNIEDHFEVEECDRIPSIALSLFLIDSANKYNGDLKFELDKFLEDISEYISSKNYTLQYETYYIDNILYKVQNKEQVTNTIKAAKYDLKNENYEKLMTKSHFNTLNKVEAVKIPGSTFGRF